MKVRALQANFQGDRLRQARLASGLSASTLAERLNLTRQAISGFELGKSPSAETVGLLAKELKVSETLFFMPMDTQSERLTSGINFRALKKAPVFERSKAQAYLEWFAYLAGRISRDIELPPVNLPDLYGGQIDALSNDRIDELADELRQFFGLGFGPIPRLSLLLENNGVLVGHAHLSEGMDGVSAWFNERPFILVSSHANYFRNRMDVGHELGHLVLHRGLTQDDIDQKDFLKLIESQAFRFGAAFLMPEKTFLPDAYSVDLNHLLALKKKWGVSIQAMIFRLSDLQVISQHQKQRLFQAIASRKWRRIEPLDLETPADQPMLLKRAAEFSEEQKISLFHEVFLDTKLPPAFLQSIAGLNEIDLLGKQPDISNILHFRKKM